MSSIYIQNNEMALVLGDTFILREQGRKQCLIGSKVLDTNECKEACAKLGIQLSNSFKNGRPCFKAGNGKCRQSASIGAKASLVCKTIGKINFYSFYCIIIYLVSSI